jgi:inward rectifier potassium channel
MNKNPNAPPPLDPNDPQLRDLGFGSVVSRDSRKRLLNRDGTYNVARKGLGFWRSLSLYHWLLTIPWPLFFALMIGLYLVTNALFATAYVTFAPYGLKAEPGDGMTNPFLRAFFFSVETFATIGFGHVHPVGMAANIVMTIESVIGLLIFAIASGLVFARFSRPQAHVMFSDNALIAPYQNITAFVFRLANERKNELIEVNAQVVLTMFQEGEGSPRTFHALPLERTKVTFFPLSWTVVHPIDETSPLFGLTREEFARVHPEFLVLLTGIDETFSQTVHTRSSYTMDEIIWNARFKNLFRVGDDSLVVDVGLLHDYEKI